MCTSCLIALSGYEGVGNPDLTQGNRDLIGAGLGALIAGVIGGVAYKSNRTMGAAIGAVLGAAAGYGLSEYAFHAPVASAAPVSTAAKTPPPGVEMTSDGVSVVAPTATQVSQAAQSVLPAQIPAINIGAKSCGPDFVWNSTTGTCQGTMPQINIPTSTTKTATIAQGVTPPPVHTIMQQVLPTKVPYGPSERISLILPGQSTTVPSVSNVIPSSGATIVGAVSQVMPASVNLASSIGRTVSAVPSAAAAAAAAAGGVARGGIF